MDPAPAVAWHDVPRPALNSVRVVRGSEAVEDLVGEVEDAHPQGDPVHVLGPHGDEQTVEVQHLRPLWWPNIGPGLADARPGHVVSPPGEAQHLAREHLGGEQDGQAVAVQLVPGEGLEVGVGRHVTSWPSVEDIWGRGLGLDDPDPRHVHAHTVRMSVLVVVLLTEEDVELPHVVEQLHHGPLHRPLPHLPVEAGVGH